MTEESQEIKLIPLRITQELKNRLEAYAERLGFSLNKLGEILFEKGLKYDIASEKFPANLGNIFQEQVNIKAKKIIEIAEEKAKIDLAKTERIIILDGIKATKLQASSAYFKALPKETIIRMVEQDFRIKKIFDGDAPEALPEALPDGKFRVRINGWERIVDKLDDKGFPIIPNFQGNFENCENGFHVKGSWCKGICSLKPFCKLIREARLGLTD